tara:strand:- start:179 stop:583 length:405 start_codon:yes stop_codon:yes gene_type:complete
MLINELFIERSYLFNRLVEINWHYVAAKKKTTSSKRKNFLAVLEEEIIQEGSGSNITFVEDGGDIYICMIFRDENIIKKVVIDILDPNRENPIQPNSQGGNVYIYGASGTIFQPSVNNSFSDFVNSEKPSDFDS